MSVFEDFKPGQFVCRLERAAPSLASKIDIKTKAKIKKKKAQYDDDW
jgi:hypothetical protein